MLPPAQGPHGTTVSVIIPSRLAAAPGQGERLFLEDAVHSIRNQVGLEDVGLQILVGVDAGASAPAGLIERLGVELVESTGHSQAAALNAAAQRADGLYLAILEDDDIWDRTFLRTTIDALASADFVSSNQVQLDPSGKIQTIFDFPTPSGWIMKRETFEAVGFFDATYRWHLDNDWLGRLGESGRLRIHLVEASAPAVPSVLAAQQRPGLHRLLRWGGPKIRIMKHARPAPLILRRNHFGSGMYRIENDPSLSAESQAEFARLNQRYGRIPW